MPVITGLLEHRGRARVFIDDEFWAELDSGVVAERGLVEGVVLSCEELAEVRVAVERPLAMTRAFNALGHRARSTGELRERLTRTGYTEATVETVIDRLVELGYLDDEEFARNVVRVKARRYGPRRIKHDLRRTGIDEEVAREAIEDGFAERSEYETALAAAWRRYNIGEGSGAQARRVYGFLIRRGYSVGICAEVARAYRQETGE